MKRWMIATVAGLIAVSSIGMGANAQTSVPEYDTGWNMVAGTGVAPADVEGCDVRAVWHYDNGDWSWWFNDTPDYVNSIDVMETHKGYWMYCE